SVVVGGDGPRVAINGWDSQSGWAAAQAHLPPDPSFVVTGGHAASLAAVAEGRADMACLDAVTWRLLRADDPNAGRVTVRGWTEWTPGLPLVTATGRDPAPLFDAMAGAIDALAPEDRATLGGLRGLVRIDPAAYLAVPNPPPAP
ncbi:MAG: phosphate/phosphite/phosphonate ABC transporter substrate-binding protein, partial [Shimia sp.]